MEPTVHFVRNEFENGYLRVSLDQRLLNCENSDLSPLMKKWLPSNQIILEAGSGAGIWVAWFAKNGWKAVGLEWSEMLCSKAGKEIPDASFLSADMRFMPFADGAIGSLVALGSIEHLIEGPLRILLEFKRVLKKGGIGIITVPHNSSLRKVIRTISIPFRWIRYNSFFRKILGRSSLQGKTMQKALKETVCNWASEFHYDHLGWHFYEYQFTAIQMRTFFLKAGLDVIQESVIMADSGVYNTFRRIAGRYDPVSGRVTLFATGRFLKRVFGVETIGHMLCYVVRKK